MPNKNKANKKRGSNDAVNRIPRPSNPAQVRVTMKLGFYSRPTIAIGQSLTSLSLEPNLITGFTLRGANFMQYRCVSITAQMVPSTFGVVASTYTACIQRMEPAFILPPMTSSNLAELPGAHVHPLNNSNPRSISTFRWVNRDVDALAFQPTTSAVFNNYRVVLLVATPIVAAAALTFELEGSMLIEFLELAVL